MSERRTIGQLAQAAGVPTTTVRYYERIGLLEPEGRSAGNYRLYGRASLEKLRFIKAAQAIGFTLDDIRALLGDASLQRLRFIRAAQAVGFTLDDIRTLLIAEDGSVPSCGDVQALISARLADVEQRLQDLYAVKRVLQSALQKCQRRDADEPCCVIASLHGDRREPRKNRGARKKRQKPAG